LHADFFLLDLLGDSVLVGAGVFVGGKCKRGPIRA